MKERGVIFKAHEVRAILAGTKTQLRAVVKTQPAGLIFQSHLNVWRGGGGDVPCESQWTCPYGRLGDRLWVRETWRPDDGLTMLEQRQDEIFYRASHCFPKEPTDCCWRSPVTMPRWASRLTLKVESVRVERLQEISEADAIAEGVRQCEGGCWNYIAGEPFQGMTAKQSFETLWESINGYDSWKANPFVWVVTFKNAGGVA